MHFLGRENELERLQEEFLRKSAFVVVYGRRRIGKTALIQEFIKNKSALYYLATEETDAQAMEHFRTQASRYCGRELSGAHWLDMFESYAQTEPSEKKVLVIDEFQYLCLANPAFASIFQKAWDETLSKANVMVILCGSYIGMMTRMTLSVGSPLYGRRTAQIRLAPLSFSEIQSGFSDMKFGDLVELYAVTGGVPKYLEFFDNEQSLTQNIKRSILNTNGFLFDEPAFLLNKEVKEPLNYYSIMQAIGQGKNTLGEIGATLGVKSSQITPYLETLRDLYLVEKKTSVLDSPKKSRKSRYAIRDYFIRFWFKFVSPYKTELEMGNIDYVLGKISEHFIDQHVAYIYEDVCRELFRDMCLSKRVDFIPSVIGSYWNRKDEIDLVSIDREHNRLFAAECKYRNDAHPVGMDTYLELRRKCETPDFAGFELCYGLFSKSGFTPALEATAKEDPSLLLVNETKLLR